MNTMRSVNKLGIKLIVGILTLTLVYFGLPSFSAYSKTFDEWFAEGWDSGCEDSINGAPNQTEDKNTPFIKGYNLGFAECSTGNMLNDTAVTNMISDINTDTGGNTTQVTPTESAYDIGCGDVGKYGYEMYINQPGNESSSQTEEFMNEYYRGYYECGGTFPAEKGFQPQPPSEPLYTPQPFQPTPGGIDWISVCNNLQVALVSSCDVLVNSDNTLTGEGQRAVDCIRNGILLAGGGSFLANLPLPLVIAALQALEEPSGCGGIVNWGSIGNVGDLQGIISLLT